MSTERPELIERIAPIEGESNFSSLLAGVEAGRDTTEVMGALGFTRTRGAIPEVLEAYVAQSAMYRLPLMSMVYTAMRKELEPTRRRYPSETAHAAAVKRFDKEAAWMQGAVADAFQQVRRGTCKPAEIRAKHFKVRLGDYTSVLNTSRGIFSALLTQSTAAFTNQFRRESKTPRKEQTPHVGVSHSDFRQGERCYHLPKLEGHSTEDQRQRYIEMHGAVDNLGWYDRHDMAAPVTIRGNIPTTDNRAQPTVSALAANDRAITGPIHKQRVRSSLDRRAHNPEGLGSTPRPATTSHARHG